MPRACPCINLECLSISCPCGRWLNKQFRYEDTLTSILRRPQWDNTYVCMPLGTSFVSYFLSYRAGSSPLVRIGHIGLFIGPDFGLTRSGGVERCQQQQSRSCSASLSLYTPSAVAGVSRVGFIIIHSLVRQMGRHRSNAVLHSNWFYYYSSVSGCFLCFI